MFIYYSIIDSLHKKETAVLKPNKSCRRQLVMVFEKEIVSWLRNTFWILISYLAILIPALEILPNSKTRMCINKSRNQKESIEMQIFPHKYICKIRT